MFQPESNLLEYISLIETLQEIIKTSSQVKAVLAFIVLLDCSEGNLFREKPKVHLSSH